MQSYNLHWQQLLLPLFDFDRILQLDLEPLTVVP